MSKSTREVWLWGMGIEQEGNTNLDFRMICGRCLRIWNKVMKRRKQEKNQKYKLWRSGAKRETKKAMGLKVKIKDKNNCTIA